MSDRIHVRVAEFRAEKASDGLTIEGYGAVFNQPTEINDWLGSYTEEIAPGAFRRTLRERVGKIRMQFDHGHDSLFGSLPIGTWEELKEDRHGLYVRGRLHDTWHTVPIRAAIESGAVDGMSFRFKVVEETWRDEKQHRTIGELALFEVGPVVYPAYEGTEVGVRSRALDLWRRALNPTPDVAAATLDVEAVVPVGDTEPTRSEAVTPVGDTRRELRRMALDALRSVTHATGVAS